MKVKKMSAYLKYIEQGGLDEDWEEYRLLQNQNFQEKQMRNFLDKWNSGETVSGNDIVNMCRKNGLRFRAEIHKILEHEDTFISKSSVEGRRITRKTAQTILSKVAENMSIISLVVKMG